jgi:hypothetical protein
MLDPTTFKSLMGVVELTQKAITKEMQVYAELLEDFDGIPKNLAAVEDALVDAIQLAMGNNDLVSWYVYDCFMGEVPLSTYSTDGSEVIIDDLDSLYLQITKGAQ